MPACSSHDVSLPLTQQPVVSPECVVCGYERPNGAITVSGGSPPFRKPKVTVHFPACAACATDVTAARRWRFAIAIVVAVGVLLLVRSRLHDASRLTRRLATTACAFLAVLPVALWQLLHPIALEVSFGRKRITYSFACEAYARDFAARNHTSVE